MIRIGRNPGQRVGILVGALLVLALTVRPAEAASPVEPLEQAVKATYLYKFTPFVEWPPRVHLSSTSPYTLCVVDGTGGGGEGAAVGDILDRAVAGQTLGDRGFAVRRLARMEADAHCHLLYLGPADPQAAAEALDLVRGKPVLTVTDAARDPQIKGIVNFVIREGRVRFEIDNRAAAESGLAVSSKLLNLAVAVRGRG